MYVCVYIYIYIYTYTHISYIIYHIYIYIYIYICITFLVSVCLGASQAHLDGRSRAARWQTLAPAEQENAGLR